MALRTGAVGGPASGWDVIGAASGVTAVIVLAVFVVAAARGLPGYSHGRDYISVLGATTSPYEGWWRVVNGAGAVLMALFAIAAYRRLPVGLAVIALLLGITAGALALAAAPCSADCVAASQGAGGFTDAHGLAARFTALMILALPWCAWRAARRANARRLGWFAPASLALAVPTTAFALALAVHLARTEDGLWQRLFWGSGYAWVLIAAVAIVVRLRPPSVDFDSALLQQKLLHASPKWKHGRYGLYQVDKGGQARRWLRAALDQRLVRPDDNADDRRRDASITLAFSHAGLVELGVSPRGLAADDPFVVGMKARAEDVLGDVGPSAPGAWEPHWQGETHVLVWVHAADAHVADEAIRRMEALPGAEGLRPVHCLRAAVRESHCYPTEHFGFRDGISQPWVLGSSGTHVGSEPRPTAVGEFVLGPPDELDDEPPLPEPRAVFEHGSFLVVRQLAQHVGRWNDFVSAEAERSGMPAEELEAKLMGRRRDGTPLADPTAPGDDQNFSYLDDAEGFACPLGAHVRRANPRDALGFGTRLSDRHRIIRRSMTYGPDPTDQSGWGQGIVFVAVNARIDDQFEFIQRVWLNAGDRQRVGTYRDPVAGGGDKPSRAIVHDPHRPYVTGALPEVVRTKGGEYFFVPAMAGLAALAGGPPFTAPGPG